MRRTCFLFRLENGLKGENGSPEKKYDVSYFVLIILKSRKISETCREDKIYNSALSSTIASDKGFCVKVISPLNALSLNSEIFIAMFWNNK